MLEEAKKRYSLDEAAAELKIDKSELMEAIKKKKIESEEYTSTVIPEESLAAYRELMCLSENPVGALDVDWETEMKPLNLRWFYNRTPEKSLTYYLYMVSSTGRVYNATLRKECQQTTSTNNYRQVTLRYGDKTISTDVHKLVALMFCPNRRCVDTVHHIDSNRHNNIKENIIWLTRDEHHEAHRLLKEAQKSKQWEVYNRFIEEKTKENEWRKRWHLTTMPTPKEPDNPTIWELNHRWWHEMKQNPEKMREVLKLGEEWEWDADKADFVFNTEAYYKKYANESTSLEQYEGSEEEEV